MKFLAHKTALILIISGIALLSVAGFSNFGARAVDDSLNTRLQTLPGNERKVYEPIIEFSIKKDTQGDPIQPDFLLPHLGTIIAWNITPSDTAEKGAIHNCWLESDYDDRLDNYVISPLKGELELTSIPHRSPITYSLSCRYGAENYLASKSLIIGKFATIIPYNGSTPLSIPQGYQKGAPLVYEVAYGQPLSLQWNVVPHYGDYSVSGCILRSSDDNKTTLQKEVSLQESQPILPTAELSTYRLSCLYTKGREVKRISALTQFKVKK